MIKKFFIKKKNYKKYDKAQKIGYWVGFNLSYFTIMTIFILVFSLTLLEINQSSFYKTFEINSLTREYTKISEKWQNNQLIESLVYVCDLEETDELKIECIVDYVCKKYDYEESVIKDFYNGIKSSPEKIIKKGGVCRDYATLYKTLFTKIGIKNELVFNDELNHVYNRIFIDDEIYDVDTCSIINNNI